MKISEMSAGEAYTFFIVALLLVVVCIGFGVGGPKESKVDEVTASASQEAALAWVKQDAAEEPEPVEEPKVIVPLVDPQARQYEVGRFQISCVSQYSCFRLDTRTGKIMPVELHGDWMLE